MSEPQKENVPLTIDTLMTHTGLTDKQVNQEITEKDLPKIAVLFDSTDDLREQFELQPAEKADVKRLQHISTKKSANEALKSWREQDPYKATFKNLLIILLDSKKGVVAKDVADYISKKHQQEPTPKERKERQGYYQYFISAVMVAILAIGVGILVLALYNKVPSLILKMSEPPKENGQLTIEALMTHTGLTYMQEQVNQEIAEKDLPKIAVLFVADNRFIDDLCEQFGLLPAEKEDVRRLRDFETTDKSLKKALEIWRNRYPYKATFKNLLIILLDNEFLKGVVAKDVANYISNRSQKEPTNNQPRPEERQGYYQYFISAVVVIQAIGMGLLVKKLYNKHSLIYTTLTMTNFMKYKANKTVWFSSPVYTHHRGYKICLRVEANGWGDGKGSHVSVFVHFMRGEFDDSLKWPFRGVISYQLMDQVNGEDHETGKSIYNNKTPNKNSTRVTEGDRAANGWGNSKFIAHTELEPKYLRNNILIFQITNVELKWLLKE